MKCISFPCFEISVNFFISFSPNRAKIHFHLITGNASNGKIQSAALWAVSAFNAFSSHSPRFSFPFKGLVEPNPSPASDTQLFRCLQRPAYLQRMWAVTNWASKGLEFTRGELLSTRIPSSSRFWLYGNKGCLPTEEQSNSIWDYPPKMLYKMSKRLCHPQC